MANMYREKMSHGWKSRDVSKMTTEVMKERASEELSQTGGDQGDRTTKSNGGLQSGSPTAKGRGRKRWGNVRSVAD